MKKNVVLIFICLNLLGFSQKDKTDQYIQQLNNSQFIIDHSKKASFTMNSPAAHKLIKTGKPAKEKLIAALSDTSKTILAHLVLCHIYHQHASFAGPKVLVTNEGDLNKYFLGEKKGEGLLISETNINGAYRVFILPADREAIIAYWKKKQ